MCEYCVEDIMIQMLDAEEDILDELGTKAFGAAAEEIPLDQLAINNRFESFPPELIAARLLEHYLWPDIAETSADTLYAIAESPSLKPILNRTRYHLPADIQIALAREPGTDGKTSLWLPSSEALAWASGVLNHIRQDWYQPFAEIDDTTEIQDKRGLSADELTRIPEILVALIVLARGEPDSVLIEQFLLTRSVKGSGFNGVELWLQRRALYYVIVVHGVNCLPIYLRHCDALNHPEHRGFGRPSLICYGLTRSDISPTQAAELLETLKPYRRLGESSAFYRHSIDEWLQSRCTA